MNIAHVLSYRGRAQGGPVLAARALTAALADRQAQVVVYCTDLPADGPALAFDPRVPLHAFSSSAVGNFRYSPAFKQALLRAPLDLIHSRGLWTYANATAASVAARRRLPHVLATCGMLEPEALRRSTLKKKIMLALFQAHGLRRADCLVATSEAEFRAIRNFGLKNPVAVIPEPVADAPADALSAADFRQQHQLSADLRLALYVGRIHPVKGVARLVEAWLRLSAQHANWRLVLAGPDEGGYRQTLDQLLLFAGAQRSVIFTGVLDDREKWGAYRAANLFVMPSDFENFGLAIAEAMLAELPVIATTGAPWGQLPVHQAGWHVNPDAASLEVALQQAFALPLERCKAMGTRAKDLAGAFTQDKVAAKWMDVYSWLLGVHARPAVVRG